MFTASTIITWRYLKDQPHINLKKLEKIWEALAPGMEASTP